ncbi:MAG: carboxypeptidase regulatory-like domain-containing protein [Vicinamibacterales bacterium]|nr:carboxypeptidase regulatory-like domain-containing protein [Vicinamibacterales bacterium]
MAEAQTAAGVTGVARDTTGAVLPGVTVEASSPALIEKVRSAVTDDQGRYNIANLRPGIYSVVFTLPGFTTFKRDAIELSAGFTATANADMKVGGIEETVTVTGASPVVDIQNARTQQVLRADVLASLPSGSRDLTQLASLTLGATVTLPGRNDVGGDKSELSTSISVHGSRGDDGRMNYDGLNTNMISGNAGGKMRLYKFNTIGIQETVIDTGGNSAESETGGANLNMVPRDGGNKLNLLSILNYTNTNLASGKVSDSLIARGSSANQNSVKAIWDFGVGIGGRIVSDRLWFYNANRRWGFQSYAANNYFNKSTDWRRYEPDLSQRAYTEFSYFDIGGRLTWQASAKNKITFAQNWERGCGCWSQISGGANTAPESSPSYQYGGAGAMVLTQTTWNYPVTNSLLVQAGASFLNQTVLYGMKIGPGTAHSVPGSSNVSILEQTTGYRWGALAGVANDYENPQGNDNFTQRAGISYVTGAHNVRAGVQTQQGVNDLYADAAPNSMNYVFRNGSPISLTQFASPLQNFGRARAFGLFAQDQWRMGRMTINYGMRYDYFHGYTLDITVPAGPFVPERRYPAADSLPKFRDVTPRLGVAYDLFGTGRTAIKGTWGRYLMGQGLGTMGIIAPATSIVQSANRQWLDTNGNFAPDCDLRNLLANGECGQADNQRFGQSVVNLTWAESARTGWNTREYNYQYSLALQHELHAGIGMTLGYFRTDWRNQLATRNNAVAASDYTGYCVTTPTDARLGDYSAKPVCGLYDVNPSAFGRVQNVLMLAKDVPDATKRPKEVFNGVDVALNARFGNDSVVSGGVTFGRTSYNYCWQNSLPNVTQSGTPVGLPRTEGYCDIQPPLWSGSGTTLKFQAMYPLPLDFVIAGTFKHLPGIPLTAAYVLTNAQVAPALGRNLAACPAAGVCAATVTVPILPSTSSDGNISAALFDDRLTQVDLRLTRAFRVLGGRVQGIAELYNVFNDRPAQSIVPTYGAAWLRPTSILGGRLFKFGAQVDF